VATKKTKQLVTDAYIEALRDFDVRALIWDTKVTGLRLRVGVHRCSWQFFQQHRRHGKRSTTCKTLGAWPTMNVTAARQAALIIAGRIASGRREPSRREVVRLDAALDEYLKHLRAKAARAGKPPRHAFNVEKLRRRFLSPEFGRWPLADLSNTPEAVRDWHERISREAGPVSANRAAEVLRATYRFASRLNRSLPPALPTSAIVFNPETPSQKGLAFVDFPKWLAAWEKIEPPIRRAYHMVALLTGARPGELARLKWSDVRPRSRALVIGHAKAGADIVIPLSVPIVQALKLARDAGDEGEEMVFPGCAQVGHRDKLPARGNMLRHTYRTVCADLGIDELLAHFLLGHAPDGISQKYIARMILTSGPALRAAQRKISQRIVALLTPTVKAPALSPDSPQDTEVGLLSVLP
jgi:integrase